MEARAGGWSWKVWRTFGVHFTTRTLIDDGPFCDAKVRDGVSDCCRGVGTVNEKACRRGAPSSPMLVAPGTLRRCSRCRGRAEWTLDSLNSPRRLSAFETGRLGIRRVR